MHMVGGPAIEVAALMASIVRHERVESFIVSKEVKAKEDFDEHERNIEVEPFDIFIRGHELLLQLRDFRFRRCKIEYSNSGNVIARSYFCPAPMRKSWIARGILVK